MDARVDEDQDATALFRRGDIFLTRGNAFISKAIRFFTRGIGEKRTRVNHVGLVVRDGDGKSVVVVEALSRVKRHRLRDQYGPPRTDAVAVYRAANLTSEEASAIVATAERQVGKKYGYL